MYVYTYCTNAGGGERERQRAVHICIHRFLCIHHAVIKWPQEEDIANYSCFDALLPNLLARELAGEPKV